MYIQFLKDKESALYFVEVSILYKTFMLTHLRLVLKTMNHAVSLDGTCKGFLLGSLQRKSSLLSTILNIKVLSLSCSYHGPKNNGMKFGMPAILFHILFELLLFF